MTTPRDPRRPLELRSPEEPRTPENSPSAAAAAAKARAASRQRASEANGETPLVEAPGGKKRPRPAPYLPPAVVRRPLGGRDLATVAGIGLAVGAVTAYLAGIWLARSPLVLDAPPPRRDPALRDRPAGDRASRRRT